MKHFKPKPFPWSLLWPSFPPLSAESSRQDEFRPDVCSSHRAFGYVTITQSLGAVPAGVHCAVSSLRKSPEWNLWRIQWFTGMVKGCFCTHLSAACESLEINTQGWSMGMIQGSPTGFQKLKKSEIKHQSQTATVLWNSYICGRKPGCACVGKLPQTCQAEPVTFSSRVLTGTKRGYVLTRGAAGCALWKASFQPWKQTAATAEYNQAITSSYLSPSRRKRDMQHPRKPIPIKEVALSVVKQEWVCGTGDTSHHPGTRPQITQQWCSQDGRGLPEGNSHAFFADRDYLWDIICPQPTVSPASLLLWYHTYCLLCAF